MPTFKKLDQARQLLELGEAATLKEFKAAYRRLSHRYHPDKAGDEQMMTRLNAAYKLVTTYIDDYRYSLTEPDFYQTYPQAEHIKRFFEGGF
jgi:preprotein translocase subunit Sec63